MTQCIKVFTKIHKGCWCIVKTDGGHGSPFEVSLGIGGVEQFSGKAKTIREVEDGMHKSVHEIDIMLEKFQSGWTLGYRGERLIEASSSWFPSKFPSG